MQSNSSRSAAGSPPPGSNTGVEMTEGGSLGCGGLDGTVRKGPRAAVVQLLGEIVGEIAPRPGGWPWYGSSASVGTRGSVVAWDPKPCTPGREDEVFFHIVQSDCDALGLDQVAALYGKLLRLGARVSRCDVFFDDRSRRIGPAEVCAAFKAGDKVSHIRRGLLYQEVGEGTGATFYIGAPSSKERVRVYDKDAEQKAPAGTYGIRWEVQGRAEVARGLAHLVLSAQAASRGRVFAEFLTGLIDFRERSGQEHGERAERLAWWASLVGDVERARSRAVEVVDSLVRRARWVVQQCAPSLALIAAATGGDWSSSGWLHAMVVEGRKRLSLADWLLVPPECRPAEWRPSSYAVGV